MFMEGLNTKQHLCDPESTKTLLCSTELETTVVAMNPLSSKANPDA